jgi:hypothetical protein
MPLNSPPLWPSATQIVLALRPKFIFVMHQGAHIESWKASKQLGNTHPRTGGRQSRAALRVRPKQNSLAARVHHPFVSSLFWIRMAVSQGANLAKIGLIQSDFIM